MLPSELSGRYEARGPLGSGAMGTVVEALDRMIERRVAVKLVRLPAGDDAEAREAHARFRREAQAAGRLSHPNIVGVYEYGENADTAWIVMELVEGGTLRGVLDRGERMPVPQIVRVMDQILGALAYSHGRGVVHRDIKPANIMLSGEGPGGSQVKIADFGIARIESSTMTQVGTVMGTPSYMAPEQLRGETVDARADIWAAGVVLYQLLTGEKPFDGGYSALMHRVLTTEPPPPSQLAVSAPRGFDAVVARALAKRPEDRFDTAEAFAEAIRAAASGPAGGGFADAGRLPGLDDATMVATGMRPPAAAAPPPVPAPAPASGRPGGGLKWALLGGVALLAAGGAAFFLTQPSPSVPPEPTPVLAPLAPPQQPAPQPQAPQQPVPPTPLPAPAPEAPPAPVPDVAPGPTPEVPPTPAPDVPARQPGAEPAPQPRPAPPLVPAPIPPAGQAQRPKDDPVPASAEPRPDLRAALAAAIQAAPCSLLSGSATESGLTLSGVLRRGGAAVLRQSLAAHGVPDQAATLRLQGFEGPYCGALDTIRPVAAEAGAAPAVEIVGTMPLQRGDLLRLDVRMPDRASQLQVSYLMKSNEVVHLLPSAPQPAGATVRLGEPRQGFAGWEVDEPYGTDLILVLASERPLFAQPRPQVEPLDSYLAALDAALREARQQGQRVAARAVVVETVARR